MQTAVLHSHTEYSTRDSLIRVDELPKLAADMGWDACAITDHGGIEGVPAFVKAAKKTGIKPIVGCELYVGSPDIYGWEKYNKADKYNHLTVLAKSAKGFQSLTKLLSLGHKRYYDRKRQKAILPLQEVLENLEDCVVLSGCFSSPFWRGTERAADDLVAFASKFKDDFFLEVQALHDWDEQVKLNRTIADVAQGLNLELVVTPDCHFASPDDSNFHDALLAVADRKCLNDPKVWKFSTRLCYLGQAKNAAGELSQAGLSSRVSERALAVSGEVASRISNWSWDELAMPDIPTLPGDMRVFARQGMDRLGLSGRSEYEDRLERELSTFTTAKLDRYFILVRRCVELMQQEGAEVGPRGSVGGSLVAYVMGITPLDPIPHGLSYERFYTPGRVGWPDIDLDIPVEFRERVPDLLRKEFGEDKVAQISNYSEFGLRMAIKDAARVYGVKIDDQTKFEVGEKKFKDIEEIPPGKELARKNPDAAGFARKLVGRIRQYGAHAGGFVISSEPLSEGRGAIVSRGKDKALCWDMSTAEELGFVKLDFLGLAALSATKMVQEVTGVDWNAVPLEDDSIMADIREGRTAALPQFLTAGMRTFVEMLQPRSFSELVWANAAFRPGGLAQKSSPRELAELYRRAPESIITYQEDVMELCVTLAGFTWQEADAVRKVIAKSKGIEELTKHQAKFAEGCVKTSGWSFDEGTQLFETISGFARYAFNKAHATSYTWNAWRLAWAKRNHPLITFAALLNADPDNQEMLVDEAPHFGVKILPPHVDHSELVWMVEAEGVRQPLTSIPRTDLRIAKSILRRRAQHGAFETKEGFTAKMTGIKYPSELAVDGFLESQPEERFTTPVLLPKKLLPKNMIADIKGCTACSLRANCRAPVPPELNRTNVLIVGEAPGKREDARGKPFIGKSGQLIMNLLEEQGIQREDISWTNATKCMPPLGEYDDKSCAWIHDEIRHLRPPLILAVGRRAFHKLGGKGSIMKANGMVMDTAASKVVASVHPAAVLRDYNLMPELDRAIRKFARLYRILVPQRKEEVVQ